MQRQILLQAGNRTTERGNIPFQWPKPHNVGILCHQIMPVPYYDISYINITSWNERVTVAESSAISSY